VSIAYFIIGVFFPLSLYSVYSKGERLGAWSTFDHFLGEAHYLLLEPLLYFCFAGVLLAAFSLVRTFIARILIWGVFTFSYISIWSFELLTQSVYEQSGFALDWANVEFAIARFDASVSLIATQISWLHVFLGCLMVLLVVLIASHRLRINYQSRINGKSAAVVALGAISVFWTLEHVYSQTKVNKREIRLGAFLNSAISYLETSSVDSYTSVGVVKNIQTSRNETKYKNIVIVILESTRALSVEPYANNGVTPFFDALSKEGVLVKNAYTTSPHTSRAIFSILCGQFPNPGKGIPETLPNGIQNHCLPHILSQEGFQSAFFQSATENFEYRRQLVENMGYESFYPLESFELEGFYKANYFGYEDNVMLPASKKWLKANEQEPFFATYLTVTPHFHYDPVKRYGWKKYNSNKKYNAYLNALSYQDHFLSELIQQYKDLGKYKETVFVIVGDHGEAFKEHKLWGHGNILYQEVAKVPMLVHLPGETGRHREKNSSITDVAPTVLELVGVKLEGMVFDGKSLLQEEVHNRDIYLECVYDRYCSSLIDGRTGNKYIHNYGRHADRLFNLNNDPGEKQDLLSGKGKAYIDPSWLKRINGFRNRAKRGANLENYDSWGVVLDQVKPVTAVPTIQPGIMIKPNSDNEPGVISATMNLKSLSPGDHVSLSMFFKFLKKQCLKFELQGVAKNNIREISVDSIESDYFAVRELMQIVKNVKEVRVRVSSKDFCDDSKDGYRFISTLVIPVKQNNNDIKAQVSEQANYIKVKADPLEYVSTYQYLAMVVKNEGVVSSVTGPIVNDKFAQGVRDGINKQYDEYGALIGFKHIDTWERVGHRESRIYRYALEFTSGKKMDLRIEAKANYLSRLFYYFPWADKARNLE